mmetsp:Transcript_74332/g.198320  ORF Transcript_74332/g.198320 Transcript_74332/m.198320 type:complete len:303 (+) Transcript_74332:882-1790(+)
MEKEQKHIAEIHHNHRCQNQGGGSGVTIENQDHHDGPERHEAYLQSPPLQFIHQTSLPVVKRPRRPLQEEHNRTQQPVQHQLRLMIRHHHRVRNHPAQHQIQSFHQDLPIPAPPLEAHDEVPEVPLGSRGEQPVLGLVPPAGEADHHHRPEHPDHQAGYGQGGEDGVRPVQASEAGGVHEPGLVHGLIFVGDEEAGAMKHEEIPCQNLRPIQPQIDQHHARRVLSQHPQRALAQQATDQLLLHHRQILLVLVLRPVRGVQYGDAARNRGWLPFLPGLQMARYGVEPALEYVLDWVGEQGTGI